MDTLTVGAAKTTLSQRVARIAVGEEIVLARGKHPIARIAPSPPSVPGVSSVLRAALSRSAPGFASPLLRTSSPRGTCR
jgi:antitoxin (DNA-binding transcriptional repressor) of toxin-antitoxin stability system